MKLRPETEKIFNINARLLMLIINLTFPLLASAQITVTNSSFSNGGGTGTDGTFTLTTLLGSSGSLLSDAPTSTVITADSLALVSLYNSTNGPAWTNKTNWLTGPVNTWFGVTVANNRVSQLTLRNNNLTGVLSDLSNVTALTQLDLANNMIAGAIPITLNNVTSLQLLNLYNNRFTGTIPSLASLTGLTFLSIGANPTMTGQGFPVFVLGLTNLEYLALDNCRIQGTLPAGFGGLNHLTYLNLSANPNLFASDAPIQELGTLQNLQSLFLNNTNFTGSLSASIAALPLLTILNINGCNFNGLPAPSAWVNTSLAVDISDNLFDFGDLEPLVGIPYPAFTNTGQKQFSLYTQSVSNPLKLFVGDPINIAPALGGTQNSYQWLLNGNPIGGATNASFVILNPQLTDGGLYQLRVTNSLVPSITLTSIPLTFQFENRIETLFALDNQSVIHQDISTSSFGGYWADIDQDGDEDLFVGNSFTTTPNFLYENMGNGSFQKITSGDIVTIPEGARYMSWGDYDNDGYPDVFAAEYTTSGADDNISSLYRNNGNKTFSRTPFNHQGDGGLWVDYNNDGLLDLSVTVTTATTQINKLYKNKGDGTFELLDNWVPVTNTYYIGWVDVDNDGDMDYNITSGTNLIKIFRNNGNGTFAEQNLFVPSGNFTNRGSAWGDIDGDGDMDLFAMNTNGGTTGVAESQFYINDGTGNFSMNAASTRMGVRGSGARGCTFGDADNDGDLDLFLIHRPVSTSADVIVQLFSNDGSGNFTAVTSQPFGYADSFSGLSLADYNNDGALDLFVGSFESGRPNYLFRNLQGSNGNNWLKLKLVGVQSNKTAIGARVDIYAGGKRMNRQIVPSSGLSSQNSYIIHSGLAAATSADSVVIHWPSGLKQRFDNIPGNQQLTIIEGQVLPPFVPATNIVFSNVTNNAMTISFTPGDGEKRVVLMKEILQKVDAPKAAPATGGEAAQKEQAAQAAPAAGPAAKEAKKVACKGCVYIEDGIELFGNSNFMLATDYQGWKVMYVGNANSINVNSLRGNSDYEVTVVEYNGSDTGTKYLNNGAPSATQRTLPDVLAPTSPSSNITFSNVLSTSMQVNFTSGNGEQRLAILKAGSAPVFLPSDDAFYSGDVGNGETAVYNGNGNSFTLSQLIPDTEYFVTLYEFNTDSTLTKYLTAGAPLASQRTLTLPVVYVTTPANGAVNQNARLNLTARAVTGANNYTIQVSTDPAFTLFKMKSGGRTLLFDSLLYNQTYYTRVKTDLRPDYGQLTTFTTRTAESLAFVTTPANNAVNVNTVLNITSNTVLYASTYTIELSENPSFTPVAFTVSGPTRTLAFSGLKYNMTYYARVRTNLSAQPGLVSSFTTRIADGLAYVTSPTNGAVNVNNTSLNITCNSVPGAASYTVQLSETLDFGTIAFEVTGPTRILAFAGLKYNTTYYNRVLTDVSGGYGQVRSFTTRTAESLAFVTSPANNAVNVNYNVNITSNTVPGALQYTIQLSEFPDFSIVAREVTGMSRTLVFSGLAYNTLYYNRVNTDLSSVWGAVRSFTTTNPATYAYLVTPANNTVNVNWVTNLTANTVTGASLYTIEANTMADFTGTSIVKTGARTQSFSLQQNQQYFVRVKTELYPDWGVTRNFTTGDAQSLAFVTSPVNGGTGVPTTVNVSANSLTGATSYTIELNTASDFTGLAIVKSKATRTISFAGLTQATTYYTRVSTSLAPGLWGPTRSFTTVNPVVRDRGNWQGDDLGEEVGEEVMAKSFEVVVLSNPFRERLSFIITTLDQREAAVSLHDLNGKMIHASQEKTNTRIDIEKPMAQGVYLLKINAGTESKVLRVMKLD